MLFLPMKKQSLVKKLHKPVHPVISNIVLIGANFLAVVLLLLVYVLYNSSSTVQLKITYSTPTVTSAISSTATPILSPTPTSQTFTSPDLGISFDYANDPTYTVTEIANKVYIHDVKLPPISGLFLEVFSKAQHDAIDTAIKKRFLQQIADSNCQVKVLGSLKQLTSNRWYLPSSYSVAQIISDYQGNNLSTPQNNKCSSPYVYATEQQGLIFFLADSNHPNKLVFVHNGQSGIGSGNQNESWYQTIKFMDAP